MTFRSLRIATLLPFLAPSLAGAPTAQEPIDWDPLSDDWDRFRTPGI